MEALLRLLLEARTALVVVFVIIAAAFLLTGLASRRELRRTLFNLERDQLERRTTNAWLRAAFFAALALLVSWGTEFFLQRPTLTTEVEGRLLPVGVTIVVPTTAPALYAMDIGAGEVNVLIAATPTETPDPTPTIDVPLAVLLGTPTPEPTAPPHASPTATPLPLPTPTLLPTPTPQPTLIPLVTLEPLPTPTHTPTAEPQWVAECPHADAQITSPSPGQVVRGVIPIFGTAGFAAGGKYKIEILRPNIPDWAFLWEGYSEVKGGVLMPNFDSTLFPSGVYTLRLLIVDRAGQETNIVCRVPIRIER
ncbi:MAG: hypothetical protein N2545_09725 [Thermoflexales bacterium]|nr:hypothetical protein [Thermoflexales bacterium]